MGLLKHLQKRIGGTLGGIPKPNGGTAKTRGDEVQSDKTKEGENQ